MTGVEEKKSKLWFYIFLLAWAAQMMAAVYFCCQKQGFHEDEYYSYYSTSRTYGLFVEDNTWAEHDDYYQEFVVLENQGFQYALVKQVQSWDVHPPVYYWIFHTVCSLFSGRFSKWFGLVINLAAYGVSMFLLRYLALKVTKYNEKLSWLVCFFYGFTPAVMSSVVFIRMYALLTVFVYLCAILHVNAVEKYELNALEHDGLKGGRLSLIRFLLPLAIVTYLGFLTQYYYFIFLFFMALAFCIYLLWKDRNLWNCIRYGLSVGITFVLAYLTYPSCLGQMFRGQRGAQATSNFFDLSNTLMRLSFFWQLLDEYVFGKMLWVVLALFILLVIFAIRKGDMCIRKNRNIQNCIGIQQGKNRGYWLLLFAVTGYFVVVSKTALLLGNTSVRYQVPIYGLVVLLVFGAIGGSAKRWGKRGDEGIGDEKCGNRKFESSFQTIDSMSAKADKGCKYGNLLFLAAIVTCLSINVIGLLSGRVVFLYPEDEGHVAFAQERAKRTTPVVCLYDAGQSWCVWDSADEFFEYDRIYFVSQSNTEPIEDATIAESQDLVVYLGNTAESEGQLQRILDSNPDLKSYKLLWQEKYCDVYYFWE